MRSARDTNRVTAVRLVRSLVARYVGRRMRRRSKRLARVQFPGADADFDTEELFVSLCQHCRVLRAPTATALRAGADARSKAPQQSSRSAGVL